MTEHLPILIIGVPLVAAFLTPIIGLLGNNIRNAFILLVLLATNVLIFMLFGNLIQGGPENVEPIFYVLGAQDPSQLTPEGLDFPIRIALKIDGFSIFMAISAGIISLVALIYSWKFISKKSYQNYYYVLLLLIFVGILGMVFTNDLFNFFVFLEVLSISSAALVAFRVKKKHPSYAGYKYLLISAIATSLLLIGIGLFYAQYGSFNITYIQRVMTHSLADKMAMVLILIPLAMKAGAIPMHMWVPDTYSEAPAPITAMLVISSQASLYGLFRFGFDLFGHGGEMTINYDTLGWILIVLGLLSGFVGLTMGLIQKDVKRLMAYCAISQTGYMLIGVGVGLATLHSTSDPGAFEEYGRTAMTGGIFHIMNHAFYKGLLFLTAGVMVLRFGTRNLNKMIGMAHRDTLTTIAFIVGSLAIVGVPPFNGFASKILIYESTYMFSPIVAIVALFISILTLAIFIKVFYSAFLGPKRDDLIINQDRLPFGMKLGMIILIALVVLFGLFPSVVLEYVVNPAVEGLINVL
jgi:multicomponent Na+:H+ antiporter subunit D